MNCIYCQSSLIVESGRKATCSVCPSVEYSFNNNNGEYSIQLVTLHTNMNDEVYYIMFRLDGEGKAILLAEKREYWKFVPINFAKSIAPYNIQEKIRTYLTFS